jgi:hypothetical protein
MTNDQGSMINQGSMAKLQRSKGQGAQVSRGSGMINAQDPNDQ